MVISWTRLLGTARVAIHSHDEPLVRQIDEAVRGQARLSVERGIHRADGPTPPHLALVDLDGAHSIETLRAYTQGVRAIPAIALNRGSELQPRLAAFANGADDVIAVPVPAAELAARIRALLRRSYGERLAGVGRRVVTRRGRPSDITANAATTPANSTIGRNPLSIGPFARSPPGPSRPTRA